MIKTKKDPFNIDVSKDSWTLSVFHGEVRAIGEKTWRAIMRRDAYTCQRCGFISKQFQEVSHIDGDHRNKKETNLECLCPLCHQCEHLPLAGKSKGAELIWLPEISQEALNLAAMTAMIARLAPENSTWVEAGNQFFSMLRQRTYPVNNLLTQDGSNPYLLAQILLKASKEDKEKMKPNIQALRLLPRPLRFMPQSEYWSKAITKKNPYENWVNLLSGEELIRNMKEEKKKFNYDN